MLRPGREPTLKLKHSEPTNVTEYRHVLEFASASGDLELASSITQLWRSEDPSYISHPTSDDFTWALEAAAQHGQPETLDFLLAEGAIVKRSIGRYAVEGANPVTLRKLVERGWYINSRDERGAPVIKHAVHNENLLKWFISNGADLNQVDKRGNSVLSTAVLTGAPRSTVTLLLEHGADIANSNAMHMAAARGDVDVIRFLHGYGANVNQKQNQNHPQLQEKNKDGDSVKPLDSGTPLHNAAAKGNFEAIKVLLEMGANPELQDEEDDKAADLARLKNHWECADLLGKACASWTKRENGKA